jgi:DNA-binding CsgD family transcriptional regulator/tetratricopeptide (TPR) repeat protein
LTGRDAELSRIELLLDRVVTADPAAVLVEGEPGIGKSRLLRELSRRADERGFSVVEARADEWARDVPFAALAEALDPVFAEQRDLVASLDPREQRGLAVVLPGLVPGELAPLDTGERHLVHQALGSVLQSLAQRTGCLLVLDDVQWADPATIEVLAGLLRRLPEAPVLVAMAARAGQVPPRLASSFGALLREGRAERVELGPLSREDAARLFDGPDVAVRLDRIYALSGGNPFYLEQLDRTAAGPARGDDGLPVPAAVRDSLVAELADLEPVERMVLECAAVVGDPFDVEIVEEVAERDVLDALDGLLARSLVRPAATARRFQFRHPLVRAAVYEHAGGGWRIGAHGRAAAALAARGAPAVVRAPHVEHVARSGDLDALATFAEAARDALSRSPVAASHWYDAALRVLPAAGHDDLRRELHLGRAKALGNESRFTETLAELEEVIAGLPAADVTTRAALSYECAHIEVLIGYPAAALRRCHAALAGLEGHRDVYAARLWQGASLAALATRDFEAATSCGLRALELLEDLADPGLEAEVHAQLALSRGADGRDADRGRHHLDAGAASLERASGPEVAAHLDAVTKLWWAALMLEQWEKSLQYVDLGLRAAQEHGVPRVLVPLLSGRAETLVALGRLDDALEAITEAIDAVRGNDYPQAICLTLRGRARVLRWLGRSADAVAAAEEALVVHEGEPKGFLGDAEPEWTAAMVLLDAGQAQRAQQLMLTGFGGSELPNVVPSGRAEAHEAFVDAALALGDLETARHHAAAAEAAATGSPLAQAAAARSLAAVCLAAEEPAAASSVLEAALRRLEGTQSVLEQALVLLASGRVRAACGDRAGAIEHLERAEVVFATAGAEARRAACALELRRLGRRGGSAPRRPGSGQSGVAALSKREREVADLVADGETNRGIGSRLFLSEKTVEAHLRNVFVKLGVTSRVAVALAVQQERAASGARTPR